MFYSSSTISWKVVIALLYCFCSFIKQQLTIVLQVYFWALCSIPSIYLSGLSPIPHYLDYVALWQVLKSVIVSPTTFAPSILICYSGPSASPHILKQFINIHKIICWDFGWDWMDQVGKDWHPDNIESSYLCTWDISPFI